MNSAGEAANSLDWRSLDLAGKSAIEASAGTGKTYTLVLLVLRLLLERELAPNAILLATFTEAATLELRARVVERLRIAYFTALQPNDPRRIASMQTAMDVKDPLALYLNARWHGDGAYATNQVRARDEKLLERALLQMDEMPIRTLHGLCRQLLSSFDLAGGDLDAEVEDGDALTEAALNDAIRRRFTDVKALSVVQLDALDDSFLGKLSESVKRVLSYGRISLRPAEYVDLDHYQRARAALYRPEFSEDLSDLISHPSKELSLKIDAVRGIEALLAALRRGQHRPLPKQVFKVFASAEDTQKKNATRSISTCPVLKQLHEFAQLGQLAWRAEFARLVNALVPEVRLNRGLALAARGGVSFDSMIEQLAERLAPSGKNGVEADDPAAGQLAEAIHVRYPVALIDEFQDTDAQQWAILQAIYGSRGGLILVGDPKQSIYRFRGSDVHTFVRATTACKPYFLNHNYRACAPLVAALNCFYDSVARPFASAEIAYRSALVGRAAPLGCGEVSAPGASTRENGWDRDKPLCFIEVCDPLKRFSPADACLRQACSDIKNLLDSHAAQTQGSAPPQVALLLKSKDRVRSAQAYLLELGIFASASATLGVFQSRAAEVLQCLLFALAVPKDLARARAARLLLGLDTYQNVSTLDERALFRWVEGYLAQMLARGIASVCMRIAAEPVGAELQFDRDARHLSELLGKDEQTLLDAEPNVRQSSAQYAQAMLHNLNAHMAQNESDCSDSERRRIPAGAQVQVMTVHKAKGLEFDAVYLPTLCFAKQYPVSIAIVPGAQGLECDAGSGDFDQALITEADETLAELLRVQYVALTRAKECVNVYFHASGIHEKSAMGWHLTQINSGGASIPDVAKVVGVKDARVKDAWRNGLLALIETENIRYCQREVSDFAPLKLPEVQANGSAVLPQTHTLLPALRPLQRRISFSSMTQSEAKSDAKSDAAEHVGDLLESDFERAIEDTTLGMEAASWPLVAQHSQPELASLEHLRGPNFGLALHALFEDALSGIPPGLAQVGMRLNQFGLNFDTESAAAILALIERNRSVELIPAITIASLNATNCIAELGFQLPVCDLDYQALAELGPRFGLPLLFTPEQSLDRVNGMLTGFIDLIFQSGGKYYLLDYKSNWLGARLQDYLGVALDAAMSQHYYHLQHLLYALALHRYLQHSLPGYDFDRHFGGAHYVFVRAFGLDGAEQNVQAGHYQFRASWALINELDALFSGEIAR